AGLLEALKLYQDNTAAGVWERIMQLSAALEDRLRRLPGMEIISPRGPGLSTGLLAFRLPGKSPQEIVQRLWETERVVCRWVEPAAIRLSVHIFNTEDELDRVAALLAKETS
ncbi:MAG: aminotransferase class V-fold PLP-dependent enzyme, partial [Armatimonadota bacterium]|nr:aminotransferase class V-fold PLP-dependent enzyme [Armatimonadota bacterium]